MGPKHRLSLDPLPVGQSGRADELGTPRHQCVWRGECWQARWPGHHPGNQGANLARDPVSSTIARTVSVSLKMTDTGPPQTPTATSVDTDRLLLAGRSSNAGFGPRQTAAGSRSGWGGEGQGILCPANDGRETGIKLAGDPEPGEVVGVWGDLIQ